MFPIHVIKKVTEPFLIYGYLDYRRENIWVFVEGQEESVTRRFGIFTNHKHPYGANNMLRHNLCAICSFGGLIWELMLIPKRYDSNVHDLEALFSITQINKDH